LSAADGLLTDADGRRSCWWHGGLADYRRYHDEEWGRPVRADARLFEKLCLEGFQSGLSWLTILRKREGFRRAFCGFEPARVALMDEDDVTRLLADPGIVRHRGKIEAAIANARRALALQVERGSLAAFLWSFAPPPRPRLLDHASLRALTTSPEARALSSELRRHGWRYVGPTTCYAFMQAVGMVNDHVAGCAVAEEVEAQQRAFSRPC
jgi:DNA-3-methyladenine glycosylase I